MDSGPSKASDLERGFSQRSSVRVSLNAGEGEDFNLAAATISDGFRPPPQSSTTADPDTSDSSDSPSPATPRSVSTNPTESSGSPPLPARPSSIAKHPRPGDSLSLRHDGTMGPIDEAGSTRSSTTTSTQPYVAPESPYRGPSNPSHPYQMYPQNVRVSRTLSVTTSSTNPVSEDSYTGPRGPVHPYSMYPQETVNESTAAPATVIPVGFRGVPDRYQRRIGPEGEDIGDIIGPDGHTEQLPPYTRYPDEPYAAKLSSVEQSTATTATPGAPPASSGLTTAATSTTTATAAPTRTTGAATAPAATTTSSSRAMPQPIPGAGGIGLATRDPEFEAIDDPDSPDSRHSLRSFTSETSNGAINQAAARAAGVSDEKRPTRRRWGQRRLLGVIPYWAICLTIILLVLMSAVLGSVVGTLVARHKKPPHHADDPGFHDHSPTSTTKYDATPIPRPTDLPALATGTFGMPLMSNGVSSTCFNDTELSQAWSCSIVIFPYLSMTIAHNLETPKVKDYTISLTVNESQTMANHVYSYGEQPPLILDPTPLELVNDTQEPSRGPAWFKMVTFNKTVILHESVLDPPDEDGSSPQARSFNSFGSPGDLKRKSTAQSGDCPWVCTWPETVLEIFIYPEQNSSWNKLGPTQMPSAASSAIPGAPIQTGDNPFGGEGPFDSYVSGQDVPTPTSGLPPVDTGYFDLPFPPKPYPKVVKMEERRIIGSPMATCRQIEIIADGEPALPVKDADGNDVIVYIVENTPSRSGEAKMVLDNRGHSYSNIPLRRRESSSDKSHCGCTWFIT